MTKSKKRKKLKSVLIITAMIMAGLIIGTAAFAYYFGLGGSLPGSDGTIDKRISFLLIGTDKRPGTDSYNADSIIVASFDPQTKIVSLLSIPRDTRVTLTGSKNYYKINAVPMLKGIPELEKQVTALTGIKLDGYVLTNFSGFKDVIDTLDGIMIDVEKNMKYETGDKVDGYINLKAGLQKLDGSKALQYARFRNDATADIGRTARQQKVLTAVGKRMLEPATILKLPKLVPELMKAVETNLSLKELLTLTGAGKSLNDITIVSQTLPGDAIMLNGLSYWEVNRDKAKAVARNLLLGQTTDKVWDSSVLDSLDPEVKAQLTVPATVAVIDIPEILGIPALEAGKTPVKTIQTEQYTGTIAWSPDDDTFRPEQEYSAVITLVPKSGYTLKGIAANFFTVPGAAATHAAGTGIVTAVFPALPLQPAGPENPTNPTNPSSPTNPMEPTNPTNPTNPANPADPGKTTAIVSHKIIKGVMPPQTGETPVTIITETAQYTGKVVWTPDDNPFAEGRQYTATITLLPKEGYTLEGIAANFFNVPGATTTNASGSGVITAEFR